MTQLRTIIVLAAGGTGGHMFPAEALARELAARHFALALVTDKRGAAFGESDDVDVHRIHAGQMVGGTIRKMAGAVQMARGLFEARRVLRQLEPAAAVGFGGYASVPTMLAAVYARIPTVIHEQNAVLGRANRMLASRVTAIATSFERVSGMPAKGSAQLRRTGNPVRPEIAALSRIPYEPPAAGGPFNLLITGGSQGAAVFGEIVPKATALLPPEYRARLRIAQQCRPEHLEVATRIYGQLGMNVDLRPFFNDMPQRLAKTHLMIGRAGASTVAEVLAAGRPALLVPYPAAMDDHQTANGLSLQRKKAAWIMAQAKFTPHTLKDVLGTLMNEPERLAEVAKAALEMGIPEAASRLADMVAGLISSGGARHLGREQTPMEAAE